jgi:hypothetical protein
VVSTRSSVTERPNHGNRAALLALRKLEVSNEANLVVCLVIGRLLGVLLGRG